MKEQVLRALNALLQHDWRLACLEYDDRWWLMLTVSEQDLNLGRAAVDSLTRTMGAKLVGVTNARSMSRADKVIQFNIFKGAIMINPGVAGRKVLVRLFNTPENKFYGEPFEAVCAGWHNPGDKRHYEVWNGHTMMSVWSKEMKFAPGANPAWFNRPCPVCGKQARLKGELLCNCGAAEPQEWTVEMVKDVLPEVMVVRGDGTVGGKLSVAKVSGRQLRFAAVDGVEVSWQAIAHAINNNKPVLL